MSKRNKKKVEHLSKINLLRIEKLIFTFFIAMNIAMFLNSV
jgi:hypothetical protein